MLHFVIFGRLLPLPDTYKDLIGLVIQAGLLAATFALIAVGVKQARAANAQAEAAIQQVKAAEAQVDVARLQFQEMQLQGITARRPEFKVTGSDPGFSDSPAVICNVGNGIAYDTCWRFAKHGRNEDYRIGTLTVGERIVMPWPRDAQTPMLRARMIDEVGIRVECNDAARKHYSFLIQRGSDGELVTYPSAELEA